MIFRNYLLRALAADDLAALIPAMREVSLPAGQVIHMPGDAIEGVYFPSTSVLSIVTTMKDGRTVETATVGFESAVGLLPAMGELPASTQAFAQIGGGAITITAAALRQRSAASPVLTRLLLRFAQSNATQT